MYKLVQLRKRTHIGPPQRPPLINTVTIHENTNSTQLQNRIELETQNNA